MVKNLVKIAGFINFARTFGQTSTALLNYGVNVAKPGEEAVWKNVGVKVEADINEIDFESLGEKARVGLSGFMSGEAFTPKGGDKEVTVLKLVKCKGKVLAEGEKFKSEVVNFETRVSFIREFGEKGLGGSTSVSFKGENDTDWKYVNIPFQGSREKLSLSDGDIVTINGFLTADFFTPKGTEKEVGKIKVVAMSATPKNETPAPTSSETTETPKTEVPEIDVDEDEIPF